MKIKFDDLPEGFEVRNGEIVELKKTGGTTGDQKNYGLVTGPQDEYEHEEIKVKYSMSAVPRDEANIEAEGGETVLTDLNNDGNFGLYDIKGSRHSNGGVPLFLPEQSFVYSDFNKMKLTKDEMKQMGVNSKKRLTPAKVSKKYGLNEYYASLKDPFADDIQAKSAELMLDKNKMQLSKLAFMQEAKKDFEEGVPVTAFPFLAQTGYDPIEYTQKVEDITAQQAEQKYIESLPPEQQMQLQALQQYMSQVDQQEQEMIDANTEQGALPPPTNMGAQQGMMPPPPEMDNQQLAQMGFEVEDMSYAQVGLETNTKSAAEQFQQKDNENLLKERIIYRLNEHLNKEREDHGSKNFIAETRDKIKKLINILSTNDISGEDLKSLEKELIETSSLDQWSSVMSRTINRVSNFIDQKYKDNTVNIEEDDEWDPAVDKLDKVTARSSNRKYFPTNNLNVINQKNVSNKESLPNIQNADILPINLDLSNLQGTKNVSEVDEDLYTYRKDFPTNNLRTVGPGQIDNPVNPFNALQDFIPQEEVQLPEKTINWDKLTWKDIPGDYTDEEKKYLFNQAFAYNTDRSEMNIEVQKKWLKDEPWAASYFENSKEGERWRKNHLQEKKLDEIAESRMLPLMHKYEARGYDTNDNRIFGYLHDIAKRDDYNVPRSDEEIFEATRQRPKGNTSTTNQSTQTGGDYIDTILDYEKAHGGPKGAPLSIAGAFDNIPGIENASATEARQMARDYIEEIDAKYQDYPIELRKRMVDFEINSEDPRAALMEAAGLLSPQQKLQLYTNGKLDLSKVEDRWEMAEDDVLSKISDSNSDFIDKFDAAKHRSYKFTNDSDKNYNTTWGPRVDMWNEGFDYNNWKPGTYYKYDKDDNTYIKSNKATTKEAKEFLDDPQGENQNIPSQQKTNKTTRTTQQNNTGQGDIPIAQEDPINKVFLGNSQLLENYEALERTFKDPNSPVAKALVDKFRKGIDNDDYFGKRVSKQDREKLRNLSPQEIVDYFLLLEKRNLGAYAHELAGGKKISEFAQTGDPKGEYKELYEKMGMSYDDATDFPIAAQQLSYIAYRDLLKDRDAGNLTDAQSKALQGFGISQVGKKDEAYNIDPENDISRSDKYGGNTTLGQQATYTPPNVIEDAEEAQDFPAAEEATVENEDKDINIQPNQLKVPYNPNDPRFWLQDLLKLNAIANRKRGKFYPWQPAVEDIEVDWVLEDPTRAIAAANEQMNIMAQGLGTFGGPQSFNARMSNIQGKNAANVANIIAGVHNRNVNTTNRGLAQQAQFDYYIDKENRARNTKLYDDTMKVEQNALFEENFDREQYADALANAYTNMANTYNMNTLYDNYNIDPTTGGMVYFTNPTALDPSPYSAKSKMDKYFNFRNEFRSKFKKEPTETEIKYFMGIEDDDNQMSNYQREARNKGMGSGYNRGYDYIGQRGREINKLLPFFTGQVGI